MANHVHERPAVEQLDARHLFPFRQGQQLTSRKGCGGRNLLQLCVTRYDTPPRSRRIDLHTQIPLLHGHRQTPRQPSDAGYPVAGHVAPYLLRTLALGHGDFAQFEHVEQMLLFAHVEREDFAVHSMLAWRCTDGPSSCRRC